MQIIAEYGPIVAASLGTGFLGSLIKPAFDWVRHRRTDQAEARKTLAGAEVVMGEAWGQLIGTLRAEIDRLNKHMIERDAECAREIADLRARVRELERLNAEFTARQ